MKTEEITTLFATVATTFQPIVGQPTDNDLTALRDMLYPLLLDIPYNMDGTHNLISLIKPMPSYTTMMGTAFPIPPRPPEYPAIVDVRANLPMSDDQLLTITSKAVLASEHFPRPTDEWEALARASKTWTAWKAHYHATAWKAHYHAAHIAHKRQMLAACKSYYGGSANAVTPADDLTISPDTFTWNTQHSRS